MANTSKKELLVIIGNGFDIAYGLKTSYKDFYNSKFWPIPHKGELDSYLGNFIEYSMPNNWYDLESLLKDYAIVYDDETIEVTDSNGAIVKVFAKGGILQERYRRIYGRSFRVDKEEVERDKKLFFAIKRGLKKFIADSVKNLERPSSDNPAVRFLNAIYKYRTPIIYSFNYTNLNRLARYAGVVIDGYFNIHGTTSGPNDIVLGISDEFEVIDGYEYMKKVSEPTYRSNNLFYDLLEAKEVVFFGHSLGENDFHFFRQFFQIHSDESNSDPNDRCHITMITANAESRINILSNLRKMNNGRNNQLFAQNNLQFIRIAEHNDTNAMRLFDNWLSDLKMSAK